MKELSIEQKARRYDEAKIRISKAYNDNRCTIGFMNEIFPELKESEENKDERIRKAIIEFFELQDDNTTYSLVPKKDIITWLEKQGEPKDIPADAVLDSNKDGLIADTIRCKRENQDEQKPYGLREECKDCQCNYAGECKGSCAMKRNEQKPWSEEDKKMIDTIIETIKMSIEDCDVDDIGTKARFSLEKERDWLKSLKDRVQPQPQQQWSEEDETRLTNIIIMLKEGASLHFNKKDITNAVDWLKSLRPQSTWRPTKEQMDALLYIFRHYAPTTTDKLAWDALQTLEFMLAQLKKLKG